MFEDAIPAGASETDCGLSQFLSARVAVFGFFRSSQGMTVLQTSIPYDPLEPKPLPGISPLEPSRWMWVDEAYRAQMARKAEILAAYRDAVVMQDAMADQAAAELLQAVVAHMLADHTGFMRAGNEIRCPDGRQVDLRGEALVVLSQLVQSDLCILQKPDGSDEHILTAGILAFPASWRLSEKFMRPLTGIHVPVKSYDDNVAKRVQRLFDGIQTGRPLWRYNALWYEDPELYQPRSGDEPRPLSGPRGPYMRSERQTLLRLPLSGAIVFGIHTFVLRAEDLPLA